ncbi:hypothetical protein [Cohnella sp. AR92]|uniref:hypothetical protein n=1 Tax=Cohnella sp. AR92 TaxID=648716 RepID=UPI000F8EF869|nr:hypothetical protein [Cohnella sp. AR92]RUS46738.1 hypothetical protein ELR57_13655 [Cohnella sp. AR92]
MYLKKGIIMASIIGLLLAGCTRSETDGDKASPNESANQRIVQNVKEAGQGSLTKENISIAGVHIGDTQDEVKRVLGDPSSTQNGGGGSPDMWWIYDELDMSISFYRSGESDDARGVDSIIVSSGSKMRTQNNIGVGSTRNEAIEAYPDAVQGQPQNNGAYTMWITGTSENEGYFYPALILNLTDDKVTDLELTTFLIDPNIEN